MPSESVSIIQETTNLKELHFILSYLPKHLKRASSKFRDVSLVKSNTEFRSTGSNSKKSHSELVKSITTIRTEASHTTANAIEIMAYYDQAGHLTEIAIVDSLVPINRQVFKVISLCLPFHVSLTKLTLKGRYVDYGVLYEVAKLLPFSKLTDICLDNTFISQGDYCILLDQASTLKCLSLRNCKVNDIVCKKIAEKIEYRGPVAKNLLVLDLSENRITDLGAKALGQSLRTNRHLLHLNLCNNFITSEGAAHILTHLMEFQWTADEIMEMKRIRMEYLQKKLTAVEKCREEVIARKILINESPKKTSFKDTRVAKSKTKVGKKSEKSAESIVSIELSDSEIAEEMALEIIGPYENTIYPNNTLFRDGYWHSLGNLVLCSLNLAYNNLDITSVVKIVEVLSYQSKSQFPSLMRVVIEGNDLPIWCEEYDTIKMYLDKLRPKPAPRAPSKTRAGSASAISLKKG